MTWTHAYRAYDDDTLATLANAGLLRRAAKAVAAGNVVQPGPGRDAGNAGAVAVAAAVVQVPAKVCVVQALLLQPCFKSHSI